MGVGNNSVNGISIDLPDVVPDHLDINHDPRNGSRISAPRRQTSALGTPGNAARRAFYGPAWTITTWRFTISRSSSETKTLEIRLESFNTFNHAQFFGPTAVNGSIDSATFGYVTNAAAPRISQIAAKFNF